MRCAEPLPPALERRVDATIDLGAELLEPFLEFHVELVS
jgi:hypothetical protein